MAAEATGRSVHQRSSDPTGVGRAVTVIMGTVVGLTFIFGFGNVLNLALRLGVTPWVAPLVAPAVDLSVLGLPFAAGEARKNDVNNKPFFGPGSTDRSRPVRIATRSSRRLYVGRSPGWFEPARADQAFSDRSDMSLRLGGGLTCGNA
jgi:hypothetical protein